MICHCCKNEINKEIHDRLAHCHHCFEIDQVGNLFIMTYLKHSESQNRNYSIGVRFKQTNKQFRSIVEKWKEKINDYRTKRDRSIDDALQFERSQIVCEE